MFSPKPPMLTALAPSVLRPFRIQPETGEAEGDPNCLFLWISGLILGFLHRLAPSGKNRCCVTFSGFQAPPALQRKKRAAPWLLRGAGHRHVSYSIKQYQKVAPWKPWPSQAPVRVRLLRPVPMPVSAPLAGGACRGSRLALRADGTRMIRGVEHTRNLLVVRPVDVAAEPAGPGGPSGEAAVRGRRIRPTRRPDAVPRHVDGDAAIWPRSPR